MAKKKKDTYPPIHRQINAVLRDELKEMYTALSEEKNILFEMFQSRDQLTDMIAEKRSSIMGLSHNLNEQLQKLEKEYGSGELDLDKGIYYVNNDQEE